jgi:hypothetical protein
MTIEASLYFPATYYKIKAAKTRTYPLESAMCITETSAVVTLQALLDHTASRLLEVEQLSKIKLQISNPSIPY